MAKTNFSYEKRQRELEKKKKAEEKAKRKAEAKANPGMAADDADQDEGLEAERDVERASPQEESPI
jgi:hypothetical protein